MNTLKLLSTAALASAALSASAANYNVNATIDGYSYRAIPGWESVVLIVGTYSPSPVGAVGTWNIDTAAPSLQGDLDFEPYSFHLDLSVPLAPEFSGSSDYYFAHSYSLLSGNAGSYDAATRTLTLTGVVFDDLGGWTTCSATGGLLCGPQDSLENKGTAVLTLTFDESMRSFTGNGIHTVEYPTGEADITRWSFSGTEVPVPAAAWLFGSGLLGLTGLSRRRG